MPEKMTARKKQAMEMRSRIQSAALDLFNKEGFENVSVEEIARAAGCSAGNIYHYFKSKDELAIQVTSAVDAEYALLELEYEAGDMSPRDILIDFVGKSLVISSRQDVLYKSFIHSMKYPQQGILKFNGSRVYFRLLRKMIADCKACGDIPAAWDSEQLLNELVTLHRGMLIQWRIEEEAFELEYCGREMARRLLHFL